MPFKGIIYEIRRVPLILWIGIVVIAWLIFISALHYQLNFDHNKRKTIKMGYMPVITNLACPLLDYATKDGKDVRFDAIKFSSFAEMGEALRNSRIQVAFMIAPLSIVLRQQGEDVKIIYIGNRNESTFVVRKDLAVKTFGDMAGKTIAVPMRYSGHNISVMQLIEKNGLEGRINIVEMNPPDMASALSAGSLDAYYVGEPFAAQTIRSGDAKALFYAEDVWKYFICNVVLVRQKFIEDHTAIVRMLVQGAVRSGLWAKKNKEMAASIASGYWNQPVELVLFALTTPANRIIYDHFIPKKDELQYLADQMVHYHLLKNNDITGLVDDRFARRTNLERIHDFDSILNGPGVIRVSSGR